MKCCVEIATSRTGNWQRFCLKQNTVLSYLFTISTLLDEGVSPTVLQLLQCAICSNSKSKEMKDIKTKVSKTIFYLFFLEKYVHTIYTKRKSDRKEKKKI